MIIFYKIGIAAFRA